MITQQKPQSQPSAPQIWNQPTAKAQIGDYIRVPCAPVMRVVDRDVMSGGQVRLLVKPTTASGTEEWILSLFGRTTFSATATPPGNTTEAIAQAPSKYLNEIIYTNKC